MDSDKEYLKRALREAETALEKALSENTALKEDAMALVRQLAHDIKNPLTPMIGLSKLMLMGMTTEDKIQPNAEIIHQSSTRILDLCEDMVAKMQAILKADAEADEAIDGDKS
jgi:nitrogen-specific signal transduction histidine kinase